MRSLLITSSLFAVSFFFAGCASSATATAVKGPDGDPGWYVVRCKEDPSACNAEAESVCPAGFDPADDFEAHEFAANHPGTRDGKLIHCRAVHGSMY
jgi:hypothetical protein